MIKFKIKGVTNAISSKVCLFFLTLYSVNALALNFPQNSTDNELKTGIDEASVVDFQDSLQIKNDPNAKANLRAILAKFTQLQANFSQKITDLQGEVLQTSEGKILLQKPQKLRWSVSFPEESVLIADGKTVYNIDPFVEQVTLIEQAELTKNNPLMLLISDQESQWQSVDVQQSEESFILQARDTDAPITTVVLAFDAQQRLSSLSSVDKQQQQNVIVFTDVIINPNFSDDQFTFQTPTNWVVDDQRTIN